jgi:hypothetical protein
MQKPEPRIAFLPVLPRLFQKRPGAEHIGLDEFRRARDGAIDMALGGEVHDCPRPVLLEQAADERAIADVALYENVLGSRAK